MSSASLDYPRLLVLLADGELRSGERLAGELAVSRTAVWKAVERLRGIGVDIEAAARRGYRLPSPIELLDVNHIQGEISAGHRSRLRTLEVLFEVDSTNSRLLAAAPPPPGRIDVCMAELQHAGRGRRGRRWLAPFGASIAMSVACTFADAPRDLSALSLTVGVAAIRALRRAGAQDLALKWPNDLWFREHKVGGILIEIKAEASGPVHAVIGIGLNVHLPIEARREIEAGGGAAAAVADACPGKPSRNVIAGAFLDELIGMLGEFQRHGFLALRQEWQGLDALLGKAVRVVLADSTVCGVSRGVDEDGALLVETEAGLQRFVSGEASLRIREGAS